MKSPNWASQQDQRVRPGHRVAVLEAHRGELRQRRVVHVEPAGRPVEGPQRGVLGAGVPVHDHRVPLAERAAAAVLAGQPDRRAVDQHRAERDQLAGRPVDRVLGDHRGPALELRQQPRVRGEPGREVLLGVDDELDVLLGRRGGDVLVPGGLARLGGERRPDQRAGLGRLAGRVPGLGEDPLQLQLVVAERLLGLVHRDVAAADQRLGVQLAGGPLGVDQVVHQRLGERRVVRLVVAAPPVADHVDDDVLLERLPVGEGQPADPDHGFGVVAVDVEDRRLDHPGHVGGVHAGPRRLGRGGEADLVVHDDVHGAAGAVAAQLGQLQGLRDHALPGERGVAVDQHGQHGEAGLAGVDDVLLGPDHALGHRVDRLQVARVGHQRGPDRLALAAVVGCPRRPGGT